jgi:polysaccharide biosynthesis protein PslG
VTRKDRRPAVARAALAALLAAALAAAAVVAAGCGGSDDTDSDQPQDYGSFFGVAPEGLQTSGDYVRMKTGGVGTVRVVLQWSAIESAEKGTYDWSSSDQLLAEVARAGLEPVATVFGTPQLYASDPSYAPTDDSKTFDAWTRFVKAAAARYGTGGDFWSAFESENPDASPQPIREWEIWNEPNSSTFWSPTPDPDDYATMIKRSARAIDGVEPDAQVISGGMFATPQSDGAITSYDFLAQLFGDSGVDDAIDVVGIHPYGPDVEAVTRQVEKTRQVLDEAGTDAPMWVTEIGWGSDPKPGNDLSKTPEEQAKLLSESFEALYGSRDEWGIAGVIWYTWHDADGSAVGSCLWCATAGLVDADRDSKPSWLAFTDLTGGTP